MQRRSFLQSLLAFAGLTGITPAGRAPASHKTILIQSSPLAGFQYHEGENVWPQLKVVDELQLVCEPLNPYDPQAVRIDWHGHKLGYIPRRDNTAISQMLDRRVRLSAIIAILQYASDPWQRIKLGIYLES